MKVFRKLDSVLLLFALLLNPLASEIVYAEEEKEEYDIVISITMADFFGIGIETLAEEDSKGEGINPSTGEIEVDADLHRVFIAAVVTTRNHKGEDVPVEDGTRVKWTLDGKGGRLTSLSSTTENGVATVELITSTSVGSTYTVKGKVTQIVIDGKIRDCDGPESTSPIIRVTPGKAANLTMEKEKEKYPATDEDKNVLRLIAKDAYGNLVRDETPVFWDMEGLGEIGVDGKKDIVTKNGQASVRLRSGYMAEKQIISIAIDGTEKSAVIEMTPVQISLSSSAKVLEINKGKTAIITAKVVDSKGEPVPDGTKITWFTSKGSIDGGFSPAFMISEGKVKGGKATAVLFTSVRDRTGKIILGKERAGQATIVAFVANHYGKTSVEFKDTSPFQVEIHRPVIVGDAKRDGTILSEQADGTFANISYPTTSKVTIKGNPGALIKVTLGAKNFSNDVPTAIFHFEDLVNNTVKDSIGTHHGVVNGAKLDRGNFKVGYASLQFDGLSNVSIPDNSALQIRKKIRLGCWIFPTEKTTRTVTIISKGKDYGITITPQNYLQFKITTNAGAYQIRSAQPIKLNNWQYISAVYSNGLLELQIDEYKVTATATGLIATSTASLLIGDKFKGNIDELEISDLSKNILNINGHGETTQLYLDSKTGEATFELQSNGLYTKTELVYFKMVGIMVEYVTPSLAPGMPAFDVSRAPPQGKELHIVVMSRRDYVVFKNVVWGFVWGAEDDAGIDTLTGDFIANMTPYGDLRDIAKELVRLWPGGKDPNWVNFGFSIMSLATEIAPGLGEIPDTVISFIKTASKKLKPESPFVKKLGEIGKKVSEEALRLEIKTAKKYFKLFKKLATDYKLFKLTAKSFIKTGKDLDRLVEFHNRFGDHGLDLLKKFANDPNLGEDVARHTMNLLCDVSKKFSDEAVEGVAKTIKRAGKEITQGILGKTGKGEFGEKVFTWLDKLADVDIDGKHGSDFKAFAKNLTGYDNKKFKGAVFQAKYGAEELIGKGIKIKSIEHLPPGEKFPQMDFILEDGTLVEVKNWKDYSTTLIKSATTQLIKRITGPHYGRGGKYKYVFRGKKTREAEERVKKLKEVFTQYDVKGYVEFCGWDPLP